MARVGDNGLGGKRSRMAVRRRFCTDRMRGHQLNSDGGDLTAFRFKTLPTPEFLVHEQAIEENLYTSFTLLSPFSTPQPTEYARRGVGSQTATTTYAYPRYGRSGEDGSSRVPLPSGQTPRPFAVRVPRGPHSTPPIVRAGPTPTVAGCSRAVPERPLPKGSHLAARNPSAPPIPPDPTTLRPRPGSPACFAIATPSPAPRPPSALRSRRSTTFQVQDAGSTPRARHRADTDRVAMGWLVVHRWAPHRQDSLGLESGMLRTSLPLVLTVDCVCGRTSRGVDRAILVRNHTGVMT